MFFSVIIVFILTRSVYNVYVNNKPEDQNFEKFTSSFEFSVPKETFKNDDYSPIFLSMEENEWVSLSYTNPALESEYDYIGSMRSVFLHKNTLYVGGLFFVLIFDVSDPSSPVYLGKFYDHEFKMLNAGFIFATDDYLYISSFGNLNKGIYIVSIREKSSPKLLSFYHLSSISYEMFVDKNEEYMYVIPFYEHFEIINITNKENPQECGTITSITYIKSIVFDDSENFAYTISSKSKKFEILDVRNKTHPFKTGGYIYSEDFISPQNIFIHGSDIAFLLVKGESIKVFNISEKNAPTQINSFSTPQKNGKTIWVDRTGKIIVIFRIYKGFDVINIKDFSTLTTLGMVSDTSLNNIFVSDDFIIYGAQVYTASGIKFYNLTTNFSSPRILYEAQDNMCSFTGLGRGSSASGIVVIEEDLMFVYSGSNTIQVMNISDRRVPRVIWNIIDYQVNTMTFSNGYLYLTSNTHSFPFRIMKAGSNSNHSFEAKFISEIPDLYGYGFVIDDDTDTGYFSTLSGLKVLNLSNKSDPFVKFTDSDFPKSEYFIKEGDYIYSVDYSKDTFLIFHVVGSSFIETSRFRYLYHPNHLSKTPGSDIVAIADSLDGLKIFNVSDKYNIVLVGSADTGEAQNVQIEGNFAYVSDYHNSYEISYIRVFDITDPRVPVPMSVIKTHEAYDCHVIDNYIYVVDGNAGIKIFNQDMKIISKYDTFPILCGEIKVVLKARDKSGEISYELTISKEDYCSSHGECLPDFKCACFDFEGQYCETYSCDRIDFKNFEKVCNGRGFCSSRDVCDCRSSYRGKYCETNLLGYVVGLPLGSTAGVLSLYALLFLVNICLCIFAFVYFCVCVLCCCSCGLFVILSKLFPKLKKYQRLRDFDILLKEQLLEDDDSVASLKINKSLFEIPYKEIKIERLIGTGGSEASVFKAQFHGADVAFKCFKTKLICESQQRFDNFEKEVSLLASLHHPNIIQFLGASLNPPRVGILMEFCEKGEILDFFISKRNCDSIGYPIKEKIRMCKEIVSAVEYIHSRNIIHRDLKPENVLVTSSETAKLMDFGISRLIKKNQIMKTKKIGTSFFIAPEVLGGDYNELCDSFSFAILLWMLFTEDEQPYGKNEDIDISRIEYIVANNNSFRPSVEKLNESLYCQEIDGDGNKERYNWLVNVVVKCWDEDVSTRYDFSQLSDIFEKEKEDLSFVSEKELREKEETVNEENMPYEALMIINDLKEKVKMLEEKNQELHEKLENDLFKK